MFFYKHVIHQLGQSLSLINVTARTLTASKPCTSPGGGGVLPYIGYIGMCGPKGYGFSTVLVINRVSILADFGHFSHKLGMVFVL